MLRNASAINGYAIAASAYAEKFLTYYGMKRVAK
jgi:hypothetical protein